MSKPRNTRIIRIAPPMLRTKESEAKRSATWLELFYDLAFVVVVAVIGERLVNATTWGGVGAYLGYFALVWWLWASHTFYADRYDTDDLVYRLLAAAQMAAVAVMAASLAPEGPTESTAVFAAAYTVVRVILVVMYARVYRHVDETRALVGGYIAGFGLGALVWATSIFVDTPGRYAIWSVALAVDLATPWAMRRQQARVPLDVSHFPERFGLFTILVLGESIAAVALGLGHHEWAVAPTVTATIGIGIATAVWWLYFENTQGGVVRRTDPTKANWRPTVWIYTHLLLVASLGALGVALDEAVSDAGHAEMAVNARWLLVGSLAVALFSMAVIQFAARGGADSPIGRVIGINRLAAIPFLMVIGLLGAISSGWIAAGVLAVAIAVVVADLSAAATNEGSEP